jgi:5-methylcytosine-specific restriction endonuclease McrA
VARLAKIRKESYGLLLLGDPCAYCSARAVVLDHVQPQVSGGPHDAGNLVGACQPCNARKGRRSLLGFLLCKRIDTDPPPGDVGAELLRLLGPDRVVAEWRAASRRLCA